MSSAYRTLPSVDRVLADRRLRRAAEELGAATVTDAVREELALRRSALADGGPEPTLEDIATAATARAYDSVRPSLRHVINATGVIIHTNLGRAPLSTAALAAMTAAGAGYTNLEFDLDAGERGSRNEHVESLIQRVTGAEAAIAVNNNASALLLVLAELAKGREVVISRGQLVEIGGGFRIPDVMLQSGVRLVEVGATNRTYLRDYEAAITGDSAALMRVHTSNFRITGFVESTAADDIARLAHDRGLLYIDDLGSGCLLNTSAYGLAPEPTPQESIRSGADLVLFSGDKLLGGPQAGIVAGRAELIARLRRHPLVRALRMDKATIAALNATLLHYVKGEAEREVPVWRMIAMPIAEIAHRLDAWAAAIGESATVIDGRSMIGGGSLPEESLATRLVAITSQGGEALEALARRLRLGEPAVVARLEHNRLLLDPRTVDPREEASLLDALRAALAAT